MKSLWAPWRMKYIESFKEDNGCIFCKAAKCKDDKKHYVIERSKHSFALLNIFPYSNGHIMVAPYKHTGTLEDLDAETACDLFTLVVNSQKRLKRIFKAQGFNIGINVGRVAGAGIVNHVHVHVVPRWSGDTNFMPVISGTKIVSQSLEDAYKKLTKLRK